MTYVCQRGHDNYYYLNDDGYLASDELVEYEEHWYYVDETGAMVRNAWKEVENTDDAEDFEDTIWYYFQSSGKAYENGKKIINGKSYIFDEEGRMLFGWIEKSGDNYEMIDKDDDTTDWARAQYYAGTADDGALVTSAWRQIRVHDLEPALKKEPEEDDYDYWFYFGSNSKKYVLNEDDPDDVAQGYTEKTIKGVKYGFAEDGHMVSEWVDEGSKASEGAKYFSDPESGARVAKGWFKVVPSVGVHESKSEEKGDNTAKWFYATSDATLACNEVRTINGKKYFFNKYGELSTGLKYLVFDDNNGKTVVQYLSLDDDDDLRYEYYTDIEKLGDDPHDDAIVLDNLVTDDDDKDGVYYFATPIDTDAVMKTGSCTLTIDGDSYSFKFKTSGNKGKGWNGMDGNSTYYVNGRKVKADSDNKFEIYSCTTDDNDKVKTLEGDVYTASEFLAAVRNDELSGEKFAVISSAGVIVKSGTKKDGDDYKLVVENYLLKKIQDNDKNTKWEYTTAD